MGDVDVSRPIVKVDTVAADIANVRNPTVQELVLQVDVVLLHERQAMAESRRIGGVSQTGREMPAGQTAPFESTGPIHIARRPCQRADASLPWCMKDVGLVLR